MRRIQAASHTAAAVHYSYTCGIFNCPQKRTRYIAYEDSFQFQGSSCIASSCMCRSLRSGVALSVAATVRGYVRPMYTCLTHRRAYCTTAAKTTPPGTRTSAGG